MASRYDPLSEDKSKRIFGPPAPVDKLQNIKTSTFEIKKDPVQPSAARAEPTKSEIEGPNALYELRSRFKMLFGFRP